MTLSYAKNSVKMDLKKEKSLIMGEQFQSMWSCTKGIFDIEDDGV